MDDEASIRAMVYIFFWLLFVVTTTRSFQKDWVSPRRRLKPREITNGWERNEPSL